MVDGSDNHNGQPTKMHRAMPSCHFFCMGVTPIRSGHYSNSCNHLSATSIISIDISLDTSQLIDLRGS